MSTKSFNGRTLGPAAFEAYMDFCDSLKNGKNNAAIDRVKYACAVCEGYITPAKPLTEMLRSYGKTYDPDEFCTGPGCGLSDEEDDQFNDTGFGGEEGMSEELNFDHAGYGDNSFVPEESDSEILNRASRMQKDADLKKFLGRANGPYSMSRQSRNDEAAEAEADRYLADAGFENMTSKNGGVRPENRKFFGDQFNV